ncbi:neuropilin-2-like [Penaeus chinensis]|uniref:neuropilin-2-like n=1 Tax=Penaeus chinensis TaxID=139456 RepID=UPI001FB6573D|nr:neuropilin-2-like [Penaeus chinensis]
MTALRQGFLQERAQTQQQFYPHLTSGIRVFVTGIVGVFQVVVGGNRGRFRRAFSDGEGSFAASTNWLDRCGNPSPGAQISLQENIFFFCTSTYSSNAIISRFVVRPSVSVCSGTGPITLTEGDCLQIHSPNYPLPYEDNTDCSLTVVAPSVCQIVLQFCDLSLERCPYDFLNITDGMNTASFCGKAEVPPLPATFASAVTVQFSTDFSQVNIGFNLAISLNCY